MTENVLNKMLTQMQQLIKVLKKQVEFVKSFFFFSSLESFSIMVNIQNTVLPKLSNLETFLIPSSSWIGLFKFSKYFLYAYY